MFQKILTYIQLLLAVLMAVFGCVLIVLAFYAPPKGHIDPTVLTAFGEVLTFSGSVLGIDYRYRWYKKK
jgi:hypothetical protein